MHENSVKILTITIYRETQRLVIFQFENRRQKGQSIPLQTNDRTARQPDKVIQ